MAITSGLFNSVNGSHRYDAKWFARYFSLFIGNGIFPNPSSGLQISEDTNMRTVVKAGDGWINGYFIVNDSNYVLQHDVADGVLKRIDRVVLRLDFTEREICPVIKKGTFASTPVAPTLQRDADAYELALADVLINNGATFITQANITDTRLNTALCGIVHGTVDQVDTTTIFNQYQSWFGDFTVEKKVEFDAWLDSIKDLLDGDVAANLANRITNLEGTVSTLDSTVAVLAAKVQTNDNKVTTHLTDEAAHGIGNKATLLTTNKITIVGAVNELFTNVSNGKTSISGAITDVDDKVVVPINPTFNQLATAIGQINTGYASGDTITVKQLGYSQDYIQTGTLIGSNSLTSLVAKINNVEYGYAFRRGTRDSAIHCWEVKTGKKIYVIPTLAEADGEMVVIGERLYVSFRDHDAAYQTSGNGVLLIFSALTGQLLLKKTLNPPGRYTLAVPSMTAHANGTELLVMTWNYQTPEGYIMRLNLDGDLIAISANVRTMYASGDDTPVAIVRSSSDRIYFKTGTVLYQLSYNLLHIKNTGKVFQQYGNVGLEVDYAGNILIREQYTTLLTQYNSNLDVTIQYDPNDGVIRGIAYDAVARLYCTVTISGYHIYELIGNRLVKLYTFAVEGVSYGDVAVLYRIGFTKDSVVVASEPKAVMTRILKIT